MKSSKFFLLIIAIAAILFTTACEHGHDHDKDGDHFKAQGMVIKTEIDSIYIRIVEGQIDPTYNIKFMVPLNEMTQEYSITFLDKDFNEITTVPEDIKFSGLVRDNTIAEVYQKQGEEGKWKFSVRGLKLGATTLEIRAMHGSHADFRAPAIGIEVIE